MFSRDLWIEPNPKMFKSVEWSNAFVETMCTVYDSFVKFKNRLISQITCILTNLIKNTNFYKNLKI